MLISSPSPNFNERKGLVRPNIVIIHYTATQSFEEAKKTLCDKGSEVSAHYLISEDGLILNLVDELKRAWHAGVSKWGNISDINSYSIGIELSNDGFSPFGEKLMISLELLLKDILNKWNIPTHRVLAHSDISPGRKIDPGVKFDWNRLARNKLAIRPKITNVKTLSEEDFVKSLTLNDLAKWLSTHQKMIQNSVNKWKKRSEKDSHNIGDWLKTFTAKNKAILENIYT